MHIAICTDFGKQMADRRLRRTLPIAYKDVANTL